MFNQYPYININDFNLDWIIAQIRKLRHDVEDFVNMNAIKYADPIDWDITKQYEKNTVVIDAYTGVAYLSTRPVPAGVNIANTDYWTVIFDLSQFITAGVKNLANSYESALTYTATVATPAGGWIVWNGGLYVANNNINVGDAYVVGGNITAKTVEGFVDAVIANLNSEVLLLDGRIDDEITDRTNADNALDGKIGNLANLNTTDKSSAVNAINEALSDVSQEVTDRTNADNALDGKIGNLANLNTTDKSSAVNAINEALSDVSQEVTDRTNADNALHSEIQTRELNWFNRCFLFVGDSYGDESGEWADLLITRYNLTGRAYNLCVSGSGFVSSGSPYLFIEQIQNFIGSHSQAEIDAVTDIVICGGLNDSFSSDPTSYSAVQTAMETFNTYCNANLPYRKISLGYIGNGNDYDAGSLIGGRVYAARQCCKYIYYTKAADLAWNILHNVEYALTPSRAYIGGDGVHPSNYGSYELYKAIGGALINGAADVNYPIYSIVATASIGTASGDLTYKIHNENATIELSSFGFTVNAGTVFSSGTSVKIADITSLGFNAPVNANVNVILYNASVGGSADVDYYVAKARLTFLHNELHLTFEEANGTGLLTVNYSSVGTLFIVDTSIQFDSMVLV